MQVKLIQSTSKCRELRKKDFSKTKTKVKKIEIKLSKFSNNWINCNCKESSNLLIIKNCTFFECIWKFHLYMVRLLTQFRRTSCTTHKHKGQHLPLTFAHLYARNLCNGCSESAVQPAHCRWCNRCTKIFSVYLFYASIKIYNDKNQNANVFLCSCKILK